MVIFHATPAFIESLAANSDTESFDRDAFRQVSRLIDVAIAEDGGVIGQQLQWNDA
jgi:hypothetical protein